ncbi:MAG: hypothetical protein KF716_23625 [Anaerolineae bacterium]|nr:hypothetical protein [Anaerolineae bacterium]
MKRTKDGKNKYIALAMGNIALLGGIDAIVNSENTKLDMDRPQEKSVSAAINRYASTWRIMQNNPSEFEIDKELLKEELRKIRKTRANIEIGDIFHTSSGALADNLKIRCVLHVVTVGLGRNYVPGSYIQLGRCVTNLLTYVDQLNKSKKTYKLNPITTLAIPIFATGKGGIASITPVAQRMVDRAIDYLECTATSYVDTVYFVGYVEDAYRELRAILETLDKDVIKVQDV